MSMSHPRRHARKPRARAEILGNADVSDFDSCRVILTLSKRVSHGRTSSAQQPAPTTASVMSAIQLYAATKTAWWG